MRSGGKDFPDYVPTNPYETWAISPATRMTGACGKQETDALRKARSEVSADIDAHLDRHIADLTYAARPAR